MTDGYAQPETRIRAITSNDGLVKYDAQAIYNKEWQTIYVCRTISSFLTYFGPQVWGPNIKEEPGTLEYAKQVIDLYLSEHKERWFKSLKTISYIKYP